MSVEPYLVSAHESGFPPQCLGRLVWRRAYVTVDVHGLGSDLHGATSCEGWGQLDQ